MSSRIFTVFVFCALLGIFVVNNSVWSQDKEVITVDTKVLENVRTIKIKNIGPISIYKPSRSIPGLKTVEILSGSDLFNDDVHEILDIANLEVVETDAREYDATLEMEINGEVSGTADLIRKRESWFLGGKVTFKLIVDDKLIYRDTVIGRDKKISSYNATGLEIFRALREGNSEPLREAIIDMLVILWPSKGHIAALIYGDYDKKDKVVAILKAMRDKNSPEADSTYLGLVNALHHKNQRVRIRVCDVFGRLQDPRAMDPLIVTMRNDEDPDVRNKATEALGKMKDPKAVEPLIMALEDRNMAIRGRAADALGEIGDTRALDPLIMALGDSSKWVRADVGRALGSIKDPRAVDALISALKDERNNSRVLSSFAEALGELKDTRAAQPLTTLLQRDMLKKNKGSYPTYEEGGKARLAKAVAIALGELKVVSTASALVPFLRHYDFSVRLSVATALGKIRAPHTVGFLISSLKDDDRDVRQAVVIALGKIGDSNASRPLGKILRKDKSFSVRVSAAKALGEIGDPASAKALSSAIQRDNHPQVRNAAKEALARIEK